MAKKKRRKKLNVMRLALLILFLVIMAASGAAAALVYSSVTDMPTFNPEDINFSASTDIYDENDNFVARVGVENREPVDIDDVPEIVKQAFLAVEDNRFYKHHGIDPYRILGAAWADIKSGSLKEGASTITQQLVRQSIDIGNAKSFKRKIQEAILAVQMERHFTKDEILEKYLNGIYLGEGAYGIQAAAQTYFSKDVGQLTLEEAALLAGLPQAPSAYNPFQNPEDAKKRRNIVLNQMVKCGYITASEAEEAKKKEIVLNEGKVSPVNYPYPYFIDYVIDVLTDPNGKFKLNANEVYKGGLRVYTTLNPKMQEAAEQAMANDNNFPPAYEKNGELIKPNGAAVIFEPKTGYVKALVGGREHQNRRAWNRATKEQRRPGSIFKPIISYSPAIEFLGKGPASIIDDAPLTGKYAPPNYDRRYRGLITMRKALTKSINVVSVKLLKEVGTQRAFSYAQGLGFGKEHFAQAGLSAALGGLTHGVTPLQMAAAYGAFANNGIYTEPIVIRRVEKLDGTVLFENKPEKHWAMKPTTAWLITDMLKDVVRYGTGTGARINGRIMAGKTGTVDDGRRGTSDIWFAGYTPDLVGVTWIGNKDQRNPLRRGKFTPFGGTYTAFLWKEMMTKALEGIPNRDFPMPQGLVRATVDSKSGKLPGPHTPDEHKVTDWFVKGTVPTEIDDTHVLMEVCAETGKLPNEFCPDRITKVFVKLPYTVSEKVEDYALRAPTEMCDVHTAENSAGWLPGLDNPWAPPADELETSKGHSSQAVENPAFQNKKNRGKDKDINTE
ncbi:penicillin-binding protein 1A [Desulfohalotomaculum tongense]|uniref:transglycosylase domain-containing protein n=1 Tax=Desulforadius tongensis TaxID=1216062 RepID=UPI0019596645|nr:PBP1A family penicillin-binding protein [Desulforadius tongensis]MBM7855101.1 penicillin-binding protein 1A [Desulforadius tongensis]